MTNPPSNQEQLGAFMTLFDIDASQINGNIYYLTANANEHDQVYWRGNQYVAAPITATGFETNGDKPARPKLQVANLVNILGSDVRAYNGFLGATITRWRTFSCFLDGQERADADTHYPIDVYVASRISLHNALMIEWELRSSIDQEAAILPRRQMLRDVCQQTYRVPDGEGGFLYEVNGREVTCPYVGTDYWDANNNPTTAENDACSKRLQGCKDRFPDEDLPGWFFPGLARTR